VPAGNLKVRDKIPGLAKAQLLELLRRALPNQTVVDEKNQIAALFFDWLNRM